MTREEARVELDACTLRPGDASEEARALAAQDAELSQWLAARTQFDLVVAEALKPQAVSPDVTAQLLAAMLAVAPASGKQAAPKRWQAFSRQAKTLMAAAAAVVLSTAGWWWQNHAETEGTPWQTEALDFIAQVDSGTLETDHAGKLPQLKTLLAEASAPVPGDLPTGISSLRGLACKVVRVAGRPASIVCFMISPDQEAHLIVMNNGGLKKASSGRPEFAEQNGWHTATWSDGEKNYMLATHADAVLLRKLFAAVDFNRRRALLAMAPRRW